LLRRSKESNKQKGEHQISQKFTAIERHRAATDREDRAIVRLVKTHPHISARETKERLNLNVTEETIRNRLHETNLFRRIARNKPQQKKAFGICEKVCGLPERILA